MRTLSPAEFNSSIGEIAILDGQVFNEESTQTPYSVVCSGEENRTAGITILLRRDGTGLYFGDMVRTSYQSGAITRLGERVLQIRYQSSSQISYATVEQFAGHDVMDGNVNFVQGSGSAAYIFPQLNNWEVVPFMNCVGSL